MLTVSRTGKIILLPLLGLVILLVSCSAGTKKYIQPGRGAGIKSLQLGVGNAYDQLVNGKRVIAYKEAEKDGLKFKYVAVWLTPGWTGWVNRNMLLDISRDGYTPVLIYYTFGDDNSREYLERNNREKLKAWYKDIKENLVPLVKTGSEVLVVLEPEFNVINGKHETPVTEWDEWNEITGKAIDYLHEASPYCKVGLCPGDWGNYDLEKCMGRVAPKNDFIAFQEMRGASDPSADTSTREYRDVIGSALKFSEYLQKAFHRPLLLAYMALSSYKNGDPLGWEKETVEITKNVFDRQSELADLGVFGIMCFNYFDDPNHGTYFFGEAEKYFGLKSASGKPKKVLKIWQSNGRPKQTVKGE